MRFQYPDQVVGDELHRRSHTAGRRETTTHEVDVIATTIAARDSARTGRRQICVAIADDHALMREGIKRALEIAPDIRVVGEAMTGEGLVALVPRVHPDVVILDIRMPKGDGLTSLQALRRSYPDLKVVMLSMFDDPEHVEMAFGYGAAAYMVKSINPLDLASTIRGVVEGTVVHPRRPPGRHPATSIVTRAAIGDLTAREVTVLKLAAEGLPNLDIASELFVTEQTVKFHLSNIYRKLAVANRTAATHYAHETALID